MNVGSGPTLRVDDLGFGRVLVRGQIISGPPYLTLQVLDRDGTIVASSYNEGYVEYIGSKAQEPFTLRTVHGL